MREASYTSLRLGLYDPIKKAMGVTPESHFVLKFTAGSLAGGLGSVVGNPFDVLKTRMMAAEGKEPPAMGKAASELYAAQGISGFYRGIEANIMRAMVLNGTKMSCYDQIKGVCEFASLQTMLIWPSSDSKIIRFSVAAGVCIQRIRASLASSQRTVCSFV